MLVKIEEIQGDKPLTLTETLKSEMMKEVLAESAGDFSLIEARKLTAVFRKVSGQVHVQGTLSALVSAPCKRCLKDVAVDLPVEFGVRMVQTKAPVIAEEPAAEPVVKKKFKHTKKDDERDEAAASFELDEVDAEPFDGKKIDLDAIVREHVLLALPTSVLCEEDCLGLCNQCGQNLNLGDCGHNGQAPIDPRFAKLRDFKLKN
jgi:uncharacterized protein